MPRRFLLRRRVAAAVAHGERELLLIRALLGPGSVFVDVGANRGLYTSVALLARARVEVIEPLPWLTDVLRELVRASGHVHAVAIGCARGEQFLHVPTSPSGGRVDTRASLDPDANPGLPTETVRVPVVPLDQLISVADVIKVDVEGAEADVLRSADRLLRASHPSILVEIERRHHSPDESFRLLDAHGYEGFFLDPASTSPTLMPLDRYSFDRYQRIESRKEPGSTPKDRDYVNNFLFIHSTRLADCRSRFVLAGIGLTESAP